MAGAKDKVKGGLTSAKGRAKRAVGKATGNRSLEAKGAADQVKGKARKAVGKVKRAAKKATR